MLVREANKKDIKDLVSMALLIWTNSSETELLEEFEGILQDEECTVFLATEGSNNVGFAQVGLRQDYVEGTKSSPVGYLEGIFVREGYRHRGFAQSLLRNCEAWAKNKKCKEFASDCELTNTASLAFHTALGFTEANRIICFKKEI